MSKVSPLGIASGHCTACGKLIWRSATLQRGAWGLEPGHRFILWPRPDSVYARVETPSGHAPGIAYCRDCAPPIGTPGPVKGLGVIIGYDASYERYQNWFADERGAFWRTWLADAVFLEQAEIDRLLATWEQDRVECDTYRAADASGADRDLRLA